MWALLHVQWDGKGLRVRRRHHRLLRRKRPALCTRTTQTVLQKVMIPLAGRSSIDFYEVIMGLKCGGSLKRYWVRAVFHRERVVNERMRPNWKATRSLWRCWVRRESKGKHLLILQRKASINSPLSLLVVV